MAHDPNPTRITKRENKNIVIVKTGDASIVKAGHIN